MLLKKWFHSTTQRPFGLSCANAIIVKPFSRFVPTLRFVDIILIQEFTICGWIRCKKEGYRMVTLRRWSCVWLRHVYAADTVDPSEKQDADAFALLEKEKLRKTQTAVHQDRVLELEKLSAEQWSDPFSKNAQMRKSFRREKRARLRRELQDADFRRTIGWDSSRILASPSSSEPGFTTPDIRRAWRQAQDGRRYKLSSNLEHTTQRPSPRITQGLSKAGQSLADRLMANTKSKREKSSR